MSSSPSLKTAPAAAIAQIAAVPAQAHRTAGGSAASALKLHWPEYAIEAWALGTFMLSACTFGVVLQSTSSPVRHAIASGFDETLKIA